jgi:excinuclease UvrABC nuclease subunit
VVRKIIPFRDKCIPNQGKPCFSYQIGLCPGVCTGEISSKNYSENIEYLRMIFNGETEALRDSLTKQMNLFAKKNEFEIANIYKKKLFSLEHINDISLIKEDLSSDVVGFRIEAYDVSHLSGSSPVGVMTVVEDGEVNKKEYRIFKIKGLDGEVEGNNEAKNTYEIIKRRLGHIEWRMPDLIVVDGNIIERNSADKALKELGLSVPIVSVVKNEYHRPKAIEGDGIDLVSEKGLEKAVLLANSEAHRFSIKNQRFQRKIKKIK